MKTPLFTFDIANNHMGDLLHGIRIIQELHAICKDFNCNFAIKFQYRDLDTFIHPIYKKSFEYKYVKRFTETKLTPTEFLVLKNTAKDLGFLTECTPSDENSVDLIEQHDFDIIKIASCSFTDWPLLERIAKTNKPIIASTAGVALEDIDKVVSFFTHRDKDFTLMHCVAEYPTRLENLHLNQIDLFKERYPQIVIGFSTHENPMYMDPIKVAIAKGARIFEKHVGIRTDKYHLNDYSATPTQAWSWLMAAKEVLDICGVIEERMTFTEKELGELRALGRGVWAKYNLVEGEKLNTNNIFLAIPTQENQLIANDLSKYVDLITNRCIKKEDPIFINDVTKIDNREKIYDIIKKVRNIIKKSGILVPHQLDLEVSHHYGLNRFDEYGCVIINFINKTYCKKLIIVMPGQKHPTQFHKIKDETFHLLYGDLEVQLDNRPSSVCQPGDTVDILPTVHHTFSSKKGAVIEEVSSTHYKDDSYYTDPEIMENKDRKTLVTDWI